MALQRPIPPPRRSKASKTISADVDSLMEQSSTDLDSKEISICENSTTNNSSPRISTNITTPLDNCQSSSIEHDSSRNSKENYRLSSIVEKENTKSAISNPEYYESKTIPQFRQKKPASLAARTSNLIWFQSGVPAEFTVKSPIESSDRCDDARDTLSAIAFAPLEESGNLPDTIPVSPIVPSVPSLYPKLPLSPVLPRTPSINSDHPGLIKEKLVTDLSIDRQTSSHEKSIPDQMKSNLSLNGTESSECIDQRSDIGDHKLDRNSIASKTSFRSERISPTAEDLEVFDDEENRYFQNMDSCKLTLQQSSINGSMSSNKSEFTDRSTNDVQITTSKISEPSISATILDNNERLRLTPIGTNICNVGWLNKLSIKKKDIVRRWCVLRNGKFDVFSDDMSDNLIESIGCKSIEMVFIRQTTELGHDEDIPNTFTISFLTENRKIDHWTFSAEMQEDMLVWMALLTKCIVQSESGDLCDAVDRAGPVYLKKGTTADWEPGWFVMRGKVLLYAAEGDSCCYEVDIRKVIRIRTITDASDCYPMISLLVPFAFVISTEGSALYAQSRDTTISRVWKDAIESKLLERTGFISEQRLTTDDIPILVEKCISFVAVYGLSTEGIYRHNGTVTKTKVLFELFMKDPHEVHLRADEYSVHDVTSVLKKYFRQLDDPLITFILRPRFIEKSGLPEHGSRIMAYKRLLDELPLVNYNTLRKLLRHLKIVSNHASKNMMTVQNLASIFGPTLFSVDKELVEAGTSSYVSASQASNIIAEMILNYDNLFNVDNDELQKERKIEEALQRIENHNLNKSPSQLLLSIHVLEKDANVFNMPVGLKVTAADVCEFAVTHKKLNQSANELALFEVICNGELERIVSLDEKLLDIMSRWTSWPIEERAANFLIVKPDCFKQRWETMSASSLLTSCDVQLSETKAFRKCTFQCSRGEILLYKNSKGTKPMQSWAAEKLFWYFGCESKRQPPSKFCLTFVERDAVIRRNKTAPFFGRCICFNDESSLYKWLTTVTLSNKPLRADF